MPLLLTPRYVHKAPFALDAVGITLPDLDEQHPNRQEFSGVLTRLNEPSTRPPNGSDGHRVNMSVQAAEEALPTLVGMPVNFADALNDHEKKQPVGVIDEAHIDGRDLIVSGHLFAKNFEKEVEEIRRRKHELGMSFEISDVHIADTDADIWEITSLVFTGAAILKRDAAAYALTSIQAKQEEWLMPGQFDTVMAELKSMRRHLGDLSAARKDDEEDAKRRDDADEDARRRDDEDGKRRDTEDAKRRDDEDDEDAKRRDEEDAKRRDDADEDARRRDDEDDEEDAQRLMAAMRRMKDDDDGDEDEMARMGSMFALFLRGMGYGKGRKADAKRADADAKKADEEDDDDAARMGKMLAMLMRGMTYPHAPTMDGMTYPHAPTRARRRADAAHDDEAEDIALFKKLLKQHKADDNTDDGMDARSSVTMRRVERRLRDLEAAIGLATDSLKKLTGLATDSVHAKRDLATDAYRNQNGGPVRRSMSADTELWVGKFDGTKTTEAEVQQQMAEIDAKFAKGEIDARMAMAQKLELTQAVRNGQ